MSPKLIFCAIFSLTIFSASFSFSSVDSDEIFDDQSTRSENDFTGQSFYFTLGERVRENAAAQNVLENFRADFNLVEVFYGISERAIQAISLLQWNKVNKSIALPKEKYNRSFHFGTWIQDPREETCLNTRQKILYASSSVQAEFKDGTCIVDYGRWFDPYTGTTFKRALDLQVDHVVPLKNAFVSGAWKWSKRQRCVYTNFLGNEFHLIPVSGIENMRKSDRTPAHYLPPRNEYRCEYLKNWLMIKFVWKLAMSPVEASAIQDEIHRLNCSFDDFSVNVKVLQEQRRRAQQDLVMCPQSL